MPIPDHLVDDLARTLTKLRGGQNAGSLARTLLSYPHFIGIREDGTAGIYYDHVTHYIMKQPIPTDDSDLDAMKRHRVGKARHVTAIEQWIVEQDDWEWLHPRARWLRN